METTRLPVIVFRVADTSCALPAAHVVETMRVLPIARVDDMPTFMLGVAVIRGATVPVIDLAALLGVAGVPTRLLTIRAGARTVAVAVDEVTGLAELDAATFEQRPALLAHAGDAVVQALALSDRRVHLVLDAARVVRHGHVVS